VATSKRAEETSQSRGTASYRAPEVIADNAVYTNKVDIWGIGCILFELAAGRKAFRDDWHVRSYGLGQGSLPTLVDNVPSFATSVISDIQEVVESLLQVDWRARPSAANVVTMFNLDRSKLLDLSAPNDHSLSYRQWKLQVEQHPKSRQFPSRFTMAFGDTRGENASIQGWLALLNRNPTEILLAEELAAAYMRNGDTSNAHAVWKNVVEKHPTEERLWLQGLTACNDEIASVQELLAILRQHPDHKQLVEKLIHMVDNERLSLHLVVILTNLIMEEPGDWTRLQRLATVYDAHGKEFAISVWRALLTAHPNLMVVRNI
jgi:serine/threonine protein kinase